MSPEQLDSIIFVPMFFTIVLSFVGWICYKNNPFATVPEDQLKNVFTEQEILDYERYLDSDHDYPTWRSLKG